jgi:Gram-negative bacterial TonB protein C-terminal/PilZ domain
MSTIAVRNPQNLLHARASGARRVAPRRRLAVPLNVTVLRSGVPDAVPGRSIDVGEGGVGAVLAAELFPGELVGVEFRLPESGFVLAKARVCYQEKLRCGLQFLAIPADQREMLGAWALGRPERDRQAVAETKNEQTARVQNRNQAPLPKFISDARPVKASQAKTPVSKTKSSASYLRRKIVMVLAASVIVAGAVGWWQWEQGWQELESRLPGHIVEATQPAVAVSQEVMLRRLVHKVDPRGGMKVTGVAVLAAVIGRDGSVISLRPVSGPEILTRAAMDALQWWKFEPYRQNGQAVPVETTFAIEFR